MGFSSGLERRVLVGGNIYNCLICLFAYYLPPSLNFISEHPKISTFLESDGRCGRLGLFSLQYGVSVLTGPLQYLVYSVSLFPYLLRSEPK